MVYLKIFFTIFLLNYTCILFSQSKNDSISCSCLIKFLYEEKMIYIIDNTIDERDKLLMPRITGVEKDNISFYNIDTSSICYFENTLIQYLKDSLNVKLDLNTYVRQYFGYKITKDTVTTSYMLVTLNKMRPEYLEESYVMSLNFFITIVMSNFRFYSILILYNVSNNNIENMLYKY